MRVQLVLMLLERRETTLHFLALSQQEVEAVVLQAPTQLLVVLVVLVVCASLGLLDLVQREQQDKALLVVTHRHLVDTLVAVAEALALSAEQQPITTPPMQALEVMV